MSHTLLLISRIAGCLILLALIIACLIYFWPTYSKHLRTGTSRTLSYEQAIAHHKDLVASEIKHGTRPLLTSQLLTHDVKTRNAVVMLHGITADPTQFDGLAKRFFDAGYNVYVPLTPHHGTVNPDNHSQVTSDELVDFVNDAVTTATGLGEEVGVVGLSGGGMLATWAAEYRPEITRALLLSPFYEPAKSQSAKWKLPLLRTLYGHHILPDVFTVPSKPTDAKFSYAALANYLIVEQNLSSHPLASHLKQLSLITSESDDQIDLDLAKRIPQLIADTNNLDLLSVSLPGSWDVGHDIVSLNNDNVRARQDQLYTLYLNSYEGNPTK